MRDGSGVQEMRRAILIWRAPEVVTAQINSLLSNGALCLHLVISERRMHVIVARNFKASQRADSVAKRGCIPLHARHRRAQKGLGIAKSRRVVHP